MDNANKNIEVTNPNTLLEYEDDFSMKDLVEIIQKSKKLILYVALAFFIGSSLYISISPNQYTSSTLLSIVDDTEAGGNGFSDLTNRYGGLAGLAGVNLGGDSKSKANLVVEILKSRQFYERLSNMPEIYPYLVAPKKYNPKTQKLILDSNIYDEEKQSWLVEKPNYLSTHYLFLKKLLIAEDKKTGFIKISFTHISPQFAFKITQTILAEANNIVRTQHLKDSALAIQYLNDALANTSELGTKSSISSLIEAQLKVQMLASVRSEYIVRSIDRPYLPQGKSSPFRLKFIALSTILGLFISFFAAMYLHYFSNKSK